MRPAVIAVALLIASPAVADETTGEILAYDRLANILVMRDRTVWSLGTEVLVPVDLKSGDTVRIEYESAGEDGLEEVTSLERVES